MPGVDTRNISRDSLFLMGEMRLDGDSMGYRVKVRNLSAGGMMAEDGPHVVRGQKLTIDLRNIGPVDGVVAWVQEDRFGIAFTKEIDPKLARAPVGSKEDSSPRFTRPSSIDPNKAYENLDRERLRNI